MLWLSRGGAGPMDERQILRGHRWIFFFSVEEILYDFNSCATFSDPCGDLKILNNGCKTSKRTKPVFTLDPHPFLLVSAQSEFVSLAEMEDALLRNLFQGYQRWVRPIQRANDTIKVRFGLKISQLVDVVRTNTHTHILPGNYTEITHWLLTHLPTTQVIQNGHIPCLYVNFFQWTTFEQRVTNMIF